jgi:hypothetical protein
LSSSPYDTSKITPSVYGDRREVIGEIVAILHVSFTDRGLKLIDTKSRALVKNEIHELMITDEDTAKPGGLANRVNAIAFFEVKKGGLIVLTDEVSISGATLGNVVGYDLTHMPNHMNILVKVPKLHEPQMKVGNEISFKRS